jgi:hypothetical protein
MPPSRPKKNRTAGRRPNRIGSRRAGIQLERKYFVAAAHANRPDSALFVELELVTDADLLGTETFARGHDTSGGTSTHETDLFVGLR